MIDIGNLPAPAPDQGGDTGGDGGGDGGGDFSGGGDQTGPDAPSGGDASGGGDISIGTPEPVQGVDQQPITGDDGSGDTGTTDTGTTDTGTTDTGTTDTGGDGGGTVDTGGTGDGGDLGGGNGPTVPPSNGAPPVNTGGPAGSVPSPGQPTGGGTSGTTVPAPGPGPGRGPAPSPPQRGPTTSSAPIVSIGGQGVATYNPFATWVTSSGTWLDESRLVRGLQQEHYRGPWKFPDMVTAYQRLYPRDGQLNPMSQEVLYRTDTGAKVTVQEMVRDLQTAAVPGPYTYPWITVEWPAITGVPITINPPLPPIVLPPPQEPPPETGTTGTGTTSTGTGTGSTGTGTGTTETPAPSPLPLPSLGFPLIINVVKNELAAAGIGSSGGTLTLEGQPITVDLPGVQSIVEAIQGDLSQVAGTLDSIGNRIAADLDALVQQIAPSELEAMQGSADGVWAVAEVLAQSLGGNTTIPGMLVDLFTATWPQVQPQIDELLTGAVGDGIANALGTITGGGAPNVLGLFDKLPGGACVSALVKGYLAPLAVEGLLSDGLAVIMAMVDTLRVFIDASLAGPVELVKQDSMACAVPSLLSTPEVNELANRGLIGEDFALEQLHKAGYDEQKQALLRNLALRLLERTDITDLWLRKYIDQDQRDELLVKLGFLPEQIDHIQELTKEIPDYTELVMWMLRDLFPAKIATAERQDDGSVTFTESAEDINFRPLFGMDLEFPESITPWFEKLGIDDEMMRNIWARHWELPSLGQGYEMFQRGQINQQDLTRLMRAQGVEPFWRAALLNIAFRPITRVDIRRIHALGLLKDDELPGYYQQLGYAPDKAQVLAAFTIKYNADHAATVKLNQVSELAGRIKTAYLKGSLPDDDVREHLTALGFKSADIDQFIAEGKLDQEIAFHDAIRAGVKKLYITGRWTHDEATSELVLKGFTADEISRLMDEWQLDVDYRELTEEAKALRDLSKTEIISGYKEHLLTHDQADQMLGKLHYSEQEAVMLLELADLEVQKQDQRDIIETTHALFVAGEIDRATATGQLDRAHIDTAHREALLARWSLEHVKRTARLTNTELKDLFTAQILTEGQAIDELDRQGYSPSDIARLLVLWGSTDPELIQLARDQADTAAKKRALLLAIESQNGTGP